MADLRRAVEKLNSDVRNYLTPILAYSELIGQSLAEGDRHKVEVMTECAEKILKSLEEFVEEFKNGCP